ncbi:MAG: Fic family protein [Myxococcota bacterium]|nr:Fic family protein [Myxococcota bacterium]
MTPPYDMTPTMVRLIAEISERIGHIEVAHGFPATPHLRRKHRIKTVQASLEIEGNTLTLDQVTAVLDGKRVLGAPRDIQEVRNALEAYDQMEAWQPTNREDLCDAHRILMRGLVDNPGRFRTSNVGIQRGTTVVHIAPGADQVPHLVDALLRWLEAAAEHPLVAGSIFHYEFEFIHPFLDGNGRLGRLWQTLIMSRWKPIFLRLPIESVVRDRQSEYYASLRRADSEGKSTNFIEFILIAIQTALEEMAITDQDSDQVTDQVKTVLKALLKGPQKATSVMREIGLSHRPTFRNNYLQPALAAGLVEMTEPNKPKSKNQQYRLTYLGQQWVRRSQTAQD